MAKTLSFTDTSPRTVKIGDTTTSFTLICGNDNVATDLTNATSITVKLGNASGYLKSATVNPTSLTDPTTGQVTVKFNADLMTNLPAGGYAIEVWVVDSTGTSIYPSDGSTGFTITNNIQSANGSTITTITFDDFVKAMNKAASTIAKGDKGDKGNPGPAGKDGTQVDTVGVRNYIAPYSWISKGQYGFFSSANGILNGTDTQNDVHSDYIVSPSMSMTATIYQLSTSGSLGVQAYDSNKKWLKGYPIINVGSTTIHFPTGTAYFTVNVPNPVTRGGLYKLENGTIGTDWTYAPEDVLTQSDYAKIKAAIVALGGSLS